jgi:hypothetical protein
VWFQDSILHFQVLSCKTESSEALLSSSRPSLLVSTILLIVTVAVHSNCGVCSVMREGNQRMTRKSRRSHKICAKIEHFPYALAPVYSLSTRDRNNFIISTKGIAQNSITSTDMCVALYTRMSDLDLCSGFFIITIIIIIIIIIVPLCSFSYSEHM